MSYQLRSHKLLHHPKEIKDYQEGKMFPPIFIEFGPVGGCNHRCVHCYVQKILNTPPEMMDTDVYIRFMEEIGDYGVKAIVLAESIPLPEKAENIIYTGGAALVIMLMIFAVFNDVARFF